IYGNRDTDVQRFAGDNGFDFRYIGDVNMDNEVDILDCTAIQYYLAKLSEFDENQLKVADTNGDGSVNILDVTLLQKYIARFDVNLG
ncbi:MAG: dockerin type I repeat-containing protein, partial [Clostridia bacterium]|nr:dockerin type I repeat-containing protein [Clostridia bacterium]